jgi:pectin methylesterase-like acyl-CoA thioesterase
MPASNLSPAFRRNAFFLALAVTAGALLLAATALAGPAATTFFVAQDGSDGNSGSAAAPWRTLQHAVDTAEPGDTIEVRAGTYAGARIERSGTAQAWLTLRAASGQAVIIDRPGPDNRHGSNLELETWAGDGVVA